MVAAPVDPADAGCGDLAVAVRRPFPRLNDRAWFRRALLALHASAWLVPVALLLAGAWLLHLAAG